METLPDLILSRLSDFLGPEDTARLAQTCRRLHSLLPRYLVMRGADFRIRGPGGGHWAPELYFDGPSLTSTVKKLTMSVTWVDQGWGNRKGELFVKLVRPKRRSRRGGETVLAEKRGLFGIAKHKEETASAEVVEDAVVSMAQPGDFYRFMRNAGGGGGHTLTVKNFRVVATLNTE